MDSRRGPDASRPKSEATWMAQSFPISSCEPELRMGVTSCLPRGQHHIIAGTWLRQGLLPSQLWLAHTSHCNSCQYRAKDRRHVDFGKHLQILNIREMKERVHAPGPPLGRAHLDQFTA